MGDPPRATGRSGDQTRASADPASSDPVSVILRQIVAITLVLGSVIVLAVLIEGRPTRGVVRVLLSLAVIALGGSLILGDWSFPTGLKTRLVGQVGIGCAAVAMVTSFLLIWSELRTNRHAWKTLWLSAALSVHLAHVLALLRARTTPRVLLVIRNITLGAAAPFAAILVGLTFRADVLSRPGHGLTEALYAFGGIQAVGSVVLWIWARPGLLVVRWPRKVLRAAWALAIPVLIFATGFYLGRITRAPADVLDHAGVYLAGLAPEAVDRQIGDDLPRLRCIAQGVEDLAGRARQLAGRLQDRHGETPLRVFTPAEDDEIRALFFTYLSYRSALLRMVAFYQGFSGVTDERRRARCFLVGYTAGVLCYGTSLDLVSTYADDETVRKKLNEPEPRWQIPGNIFDEIRWSTCSPRNLELFEEMKAYYEAHRDTWRDCGLGTADVAFLEQTIESASTEIETDPLHGRRPSLSQVILERVKEDAYRPAYAVQSLVSTWIGDTRLVSRPATISPEKVESMRARLRPGDIILERRNWYLSNAFLPGFWPHAALYVGTHDDLERLGISGAPEVRDRLAEYLAPADGGEPRVVIESISEGVSFTSLSEATLADYIAVLRPRLDREQRARAIVKAFSHQGKPYDFEFDFFSSDKLVCTELVYRAYEGLLHFELVEVMGRMTLPALEIARKHRNERGTPEQELDFVLFLDTPTGGGPADFVTEAAFLGSVDRPRAFNE